MVNAQFFKRFISFDGVPHDSSEVSWLKEEFAVWLKALDYSNQQISEQRPIGKVRLSAAIGGRDGNRMSTILNECGAHYYPVVFNNSCSSFPESSTRFVAAGASVYVGTALDIPDPIAEQVGISFCADVAKGCNIAFALFKAQQPFSAEYSRYLMHGCIVSQLRPVKPYNKNTERAKRAIGLHAQRLREFIHTAKRPVIRRWAEQAHTMLVEELGKLSSLR